MCLRNRKVELVWVKGHNGHPLQETTDRLARAALIEREAGIAHQLATDQLGGHH